MFEAVVNRQFKTYFSGLSGSVNMGAITVLRRIFNVHKIDGYVLIDNIENQVVLMKKKEFDSLCEYIKVDLERTSAIPRATIEKRGSVKAINMGTGGYLPYRMVSFREYSNYLNTTYYTKIQEYNYMTLRYMNFSHYEVIFKAMNSEMKSYISEMYSKYGEKLNKLMSNRGYNAEEYEVLLLALANVGVGELDLEGFTELCNVRELGARGLRTKLGLLMAKYKRKVEKGIDVKKEQENEVSKNTVFWFMPFLEGHPETFQILSTSDDGLVSFNYSFNEYTVPIDIKGNIRIKSGKIVTRLRDIEKKLTFHYINENEISKMSEQECFDDLIKGCNYILKHCIPEEKLDSLWFMPFLETHPDIFQGISKGDKDLVSFTYVFNEYTVPIDIKGNVHAKNGNIYTRVRDAKTKLTFYYIDEKERRSMNEQECFDKLIDACNYILKSYLPKEENWFTTIFKENPTLFRQVTLQRNGSYNFQYLYNGVRVLLNIRKGADLNTINGLSTVLIDGTKKVTSVIFEEDRIVGMLKEQQMNELIDGCNYIAERVTKSKKDVQNFEIQKPTQSTIMKNSTITQIKTLEKEIDAINQRISELSTRVPIINSGTYFIDLLSELDGVIVQFVGESRGRPFAIFSYTDGNPTTSDKLVSFFTLSYFDNHYIWIQSLEPTHNDHYFRGLAVDAVSVNGIYSMLSDYIERYGYECYMSEEEAIQKYSWYRPYFIQSMIKDLENKKEEIYDKIRRLEGRLTGIEDSAYKEDLKKKGNKYLGKMLELFDFNDIGTGLPL